MRYNCSTCGASLPAYKEKAVFVKCEYCGGENLLPKARNMERQINRTLYFRQKCEFDIAQGIYQTLLKEGAIFVPDTEKCAFVGLIYLRYELKKSLKNKEKTLD